MVPAATFVVASVKYEVPPSLTEDALEVMQQMNYIPSY
jgi:hypothetical protein